MDEIYSTWMKIWKTKKPKSKWNPKNCNKFLKKQSKENNMWQDQIVVKP
jgi:hypothetical protein